MDDAHRIVEAQYRAAKKGRLAMWTVYDHPKDFPHSYVARRFEVGDGEPEPTGDIVQGELSAIRASFMVAGLHCLKRDAGDDPKVIETWL